MACLITHFIVRIGKSCWGSYLHEGQLFGISLEYHDGTIGQCWNGRSLIQATRHYVDALFVSGTPTPDMFTLDTAMCQQKKPLFDYILCLIDLEVHLHNAIDLPCGYPHVFPPLPKRHQVHLKRG